MNKLIEFVAAAAGMIAGLFVLAATIIRLFSSVPFWKAVRHPSRFRLVFQLGKKALAERRDRADHLKHPERYRGR